MSLLDRMKTKAVANRVSGKHPLLKMEAELSVRDLYFRGVVLAAYLDDGQVDEAEKAYLRKVGTGMNLSEVDVNEVIAEVGALKTEKEQMLLVEDIAVHLKEPRIAKLFLCEFSFVWMSHAGDAELLRSYRSVFAELMQVDVPPVWFDKLDVAIASPEKRAGIAAKMRDLGDDGLAYLFCDVAEEIKAVQGKDAADEQRRALEKWLVSEIEDDAAWPVSFDVDNIRDRFAKAGIRDHFVSTLLKMLLPHARIAYEAAKDAIRRDRTNGRRDPNDWIVFLPDIPAACRLFGYAKCMDSVLSILGHTIFTDTYRTLYWGWRGNTETVARNRDLALSKFFKCWDSLFGEFEYRASY